MCFGAILLSGIQTIVYAFEDPMGGGSACDLSSLPILYKNSGIQIKKGSAVGKVLIFFLNFLIKRTINTGRTVCWNSMYGTRGNGWRLNKYCFFINCLL